MTRIRFAILISFTFVLCACALQAHAWDDVDGPAAGEPESIGRYAAGCVIGAARLPPDGPGYQAIRLERIGPSQ